MEDLGGAAGFAHAAVGFEPGGEGGFGLMPMGDGGLVAPVEEMGHGLLVGAGDDVVAHGFVPCGEGPEGEAAIGEEGSGLEAEGVLDLALGAQGVDGEAGKEADGAEAEAGEAEEGQMVS